MLPSLAGEYIKVCENGQGTVGFSETFVHSLSGANNLVILIGAGVSQESGIPTFRGEDGLWRRYREKN